MSGGNTFLTGYEWSVRSTLQEAVLNPLASPSELAYSERLETKFLVCLYMEPKVSDKHYWKTIDRLCLCFYHL